MEIEEIKTSELTIDELNAKVMEKKPIKGMRDLMASILCDVLDSTLLSESVWDLVDYYEDFTKDEGVLKSYRRIGSISYLVVDKLRDVKNKLNRLEEEILKIDK